MRGLGAILLGALTSGVAVACFVSLPEVDTSDAGSAILADGGDATLEPPDASAASNDSSPNAPDSSSAFCASATGALLCLDFDDGELTTKGWAFETQDPAGGKQPVSLAVSNLFFSSPPHSLGIVVDKNPTLNIGQRYLTHALDSPKHVRVSGKVVVSAGSDRLTFASLSIGADTFPLTLFAHATDFGCQLNSNAGNFTCTGERSPYGVSHPFSIDIDLEKDGGTASIIVGSQSVSTTNFSPGGGAFKKILVGGSAAAGFNGSWRLNVDDVRVDP